MPVTHVPNPYAADGQSNAVGETNMPVKNPNQPVVYVPSPTAADGTDGTGGGTNSGNGAPTASTTGTLYINNLDSTLWAKVNGTWTQLV